MSQNTLNFRTMIELLFLKKMLANIYESSGLAASFLAEWMKSMLILYIPIDLFSPYNVRIIPSYAMILLTYWLEAHGDSGGSRGGMRGMHPPTGPAHR